MSTPEISRVTVRDYREVSARVSGKPPLYTAKGNRPLDPLSVTIRYAIGTDRVYVTIGGEKLFKESGMRGLSPYTQTHSRRRFSAADDDALPHWVHDLIDQHRPVEADGGWWK